MTENNTQSAECLSHLTAELEVLTHGDELTHDERLRMKWAYITEQNTRLALENKALKLWVLSLLNSDGFDDGRYDAHDLRIARDKLKEILDNPISI